MAVTSWSPTTSKGSNVPYRMRLHYTYKRVAGGVDLTFGVEVNYPTYWSSNGAWIFYDGKSERLNNPRTTGKYTWKTKNNSWISNKRISMSDSAQTVNVSIGFANTAWVESRAKAHHNFVLQVGTAPKAPKEPTRPSTPTQSQSNYDASFPRVPFARLSYSNGSVIGEWGTLPYGYKYDVKLEQNGDYVYLTFYTNDNRRNFGEPSEFYNYRLRVRAYKNGVYGPWTSSDYLKVTDRDIVNEWGSISSAFRWSNYNTELTIGSSGKMAEVTVDGSPYRTGACPIRINFSNKMLQRVNVNARYFSGNEKGTWYQDSRVVGSGDVNLSYNSSTDKLTYGIQNVRPSNASFSVSSSLVMSGEGGSATINKIFSRSVTSDTIDKPWIFAKQNLHDKLPLGKSVTYSFALAEGDTAESVSVGSPNVSLSAKIVRVDGMDDPIKDEAGNPIIRNNIEVLTTGNDINRVVYRWDNGTEIAKVDNFTGTHTQLIEVYNETGAEIIVEGYIVENGYTFKVSETKATWKAEHGGGTGIQRLTPIYLAVNSVLKEQGSVLNTDPPMIAWENTNKWTEGFGKRKFRIEEVDLMFGEDVIGTLTLDNFIVENPLDITKVTMWYRDSPDGLVLMFVQFGDKRITNINHTLGYNRRVPLSQKIHCVEVVNGHSVSERRVLENYIGMINTIHLPTKPKFVKYVVI